MNNFQKFRTKILAVNRPISRFTFEVVQISSANRAYRQRVTETL